MENIMENNVEEQEIWRPENDKRLYQGLRLANEMNVVLIHDPEAEIAAAALNINIGSAIEIKMGHPAGLARLFQRILYLSDRQPQPKSFNNFVKRHNGEVDAETRTSCADYYFNINSSHLKDALGYFAKFFCEQAPSCSHLTIESEYNVILKIEETNKLHDEWKLPKFIKYIRFNHESKASDYKWREYEPEKSLTEEPAIDTKMLEKFYKDYYYSEDMTLYVLGKESLDELKEMVVEFFSPVRERTIPDSGIFPQVTMAPPSFVHKIYYVPNKDCNQLHLVAHPVYLTRNIPNMPDRIFAYLLKYNGEKSLLSVLKAKGWATSIGAGLLTEIHDVFLVTIDLTEKGLDHVDEVVTLFFEYVHMLRRENNDYKRIVNEYKKIQELQLYFEEKKFFPKYVRLYAQMHGWPKKHVLREKPIPLKWHIEAMQCVFEPFLPPLRLSIYVASQKYKILTDKSCDYYEYKIERVPSKTYARWIEDNNTLSKIFKFPSCNEFIPTDINIKETDEAEKHIRIIKKTKLLTFWHKKDDEFKEPKATMIFHFINPVVYVDTINANHALMFIRIINESLSECAYAAALVGLHWEFSTTNRGIQLKIHGFDNKLPNLVEKIFDQIINFEVEINKFEAHRQNNIDIIKKELQEFQESSPHRQVQHYLSVILSNNMWQREDILKSSSDVTFESFREFVSDFLYAIYVDGLIYGNVTEADAQTVADMIENKLSNVSKSFKPIRKYDRSILVDNKHYYVFCKGNKVSLDSCMLVFCQIDRKTIQWDVILDFIGEVINQINYTIFKEKTSLIYAPCVDVYRSVGTQGLVIMVQNPKSNVDKYIQEFLLTVMEHINNMSEEMFKAIKELMIQVRRDKKPKTMLEQSEVLWNEILKDQYIFGRIDLEIEELHKLTLRECQQFFKKFLIDKSPNLSVYLIPCLILNLTPSGNVGVPKVMFEKNVKRITDILSFKCSQCLCAMPNC